MAITRQSTLVSLALAGSLAGQTISGSITGTVKDSSDLPVAAAPVVLTQPGTGAQWKTTTDQRGDFRFASLQPSEYALAVEVKGFKRLEKRSIILPASETVAVGDLRLEIGVTTETVTVTAEGATVQTASSERAGLISTNQVDGLLNRGRNITSLLELLPGVVDVQGARDNLARNWVLHVQGNRRGTNNFTLDGVTQNSTAIQANMSVTVSQDAIAEVKVLLTNYQAEYGRLSGANIVLVTKSGTREFHGLASYFKRHEQFNANGFFNNRLGLPKGRYRFNTFNYNLSGPLYIPGKFNRNRERLFFFWSQEFWPNRQSYQGNITVPAEAELQGDFSKTVDLNQRLITVRDPASGQNFPGNIVPASRLNQNSVALMKVFPRPNFSNLAVSGGRYNYVYQGDYRAPQGTSTFKLDVPLNSGNNLFLTWTEASDFFYGARGSASTTSNWPLYSLDEDDGGRALALRYARIFSPTLINEMTLGYNLLNSTRRFSSEEDLRRIQRDVVGFQAGQLYPGANSLGIIPNATFSGVTGAGTLSVDGRLPQETYRPYLSWADSVTKTIGSHTLKAGIAIDWLGNNSTARVTFNGTVNFGRDANNPLDTGYAFSNAALGIFSSYTESSRRTRNHERSAGREWFVQDTWRATRRLTLDYGVRFTDVTMPYERDNLLSSFDLSRWDPRRSVRLIAPGRSGTRRVGVHPVTGEIFPQALIGSIAPGVGDRTNGLVVAGEDPSYDRGLIGDIGLTADPRFGFAYDPFGKGKTAIRGGFGMFHNRHDLPKAGAGYPIIDNPTVYYSTLAELFSNPLFYTPQSVGSVDFQGGRPAVMNFSLGVQQHVGWKTVVEAGYVGSLGRHLLWTRNLNAVGFGANFKPENQDPTSPGTPLAAAFLRPFLGLNDLPRDEYASSSNYHSLQVTANRRFSQGLQFGASWTWSKSMDFNSADGDYISPFVPVRVWNYGLSSFDRTHVLKLNWLWAAPRLPAGNPVLTRVVNGWEISGVASFISGAPATVGWSTTRAIDITGSPTEGARIVVTGNPVLPKSERTFSRFLRTDVFQLPAVGTYGNAARSILRGPGINNFDIALFKTVPVHERVRLQVRAEMYNAFNHTQFSSFDAGTRFDETGKQVNARFGEMTGARSSRVIQMTMRLYF